MEKLGRYNINPEELLNPQNTALIVVDPQFDYCSPKGKLSTLRGYDMTPIQKIMPNLDFFIDKSRKYGLKIIWTKMDETPSHMPNNFRQLMESTDEFPLELCTPGTPGYEYYLISPKEDDKEILKNQYDAFSNPELELYLKENNIKTVIFTGFYTSRCVDSTLRSAARIGYNCIAVENLIGMTSANEHQLEHRSAISTWNRLFAYVVKSDDVLKTFEKYFKE